MITVREFNELLEQLSFIRMGERIIACALYDTSSDDRKQEMYEFYQKIIKQYRMLEKKYYEDKEVMRKNLIDKLRSIKTEHENKFQYTD